MTCKILFAITIFAIALGIYGVWSNSIVLLGIGFVVHLICSLILRGKKFCQVY